MAANILEFRKKKHLNIGVIIFGIIFVYLLVTIVLYLTRKHVTIYEVREGTIVKENAYTGIAIREEDVFYAEQSGYINYYIENTNKIKKSSNIYSITDQELNFEKSDADTSISLSDREKQDFILTIQSFLEQFNTNDFSFTYQYKEELENKVDSITNQTKLDLVEEQGTVELQKSEDDGIIVYSTDGLEDVNLDTFTLSLFEKGDYQCKEFTNNMQVKNGDPIYKLITDTNWKILFLIDEETKNLLSEKKSVNVLFQKDNQQVSASISFLEYEGKDVGCLTFQTGMVRYANERYLNFELILENESGLKIPKTSVVKKDFYIVPKSYLTKGGNSNSDGIMIQSTNGDGESITEFCSVSIYYDDGEYVYLDPNQFDEETTILKPESSDTYTLSETAALDGVYNINKGYAVFKLVQILCESDEYYIVQEGNSYGLSNYDHIALDSSNIKENDVVF